MEQPDLSSPSPLKVLKALTHIRCMLCLYHYCQQQQQLHLAACRSPVKHTACSAQSLLPGLWLAYECTTSWLLISLVIEEDLKADLACRSQAKMGSLQSSR